MTAPPRSRRGQLDFLPLERADCQFVSHQQHGDYHAHILRTRAEFPEKPIFNIEFLYEVRRSRRHPASPRRRRGTSKQRALMICPAQMGALQTYGPQSRPEAMRSVLWSIYMAGGEGLPLSGRLLFSHYIGCTEGGMRD
jgi:hypothetical protein